MALFTKPNIYIEQVYVFQNIHIHMKEEQTMAICKNMDESQYPIEQNEPDSKKQDNSWILQEADAKTELEAQRFPGNRNGQGESLNLTFRKERTQAGQKETQPSVWLLEDLGETIEGLQHKAGSPSSQKWKALEPLCSLTDRSVQSLTLPQKLKHHQDKRPSLGNIVNGTGMASMQ